MSAEAIAKVVRDFRQPCEGQPCRARIFKPYNEMRSVRGVARLAGLKETLRT
jgi:hypothetical protein